MTASLWINTHSFLPVYWLKTIYYWQSFILLLLDKNDSSNMYFTFRWILILFKREFSMTDIMRLWEVSIQHITGCRRLCRCVYQFLWRNQVKMGQDVIILLRFNGAGRLMISLHGQTTKSLRNFGSKLFEGLHWFLLI